MFPLIHSAAGTAGADDKHLAGCNADVPSFRVVVVPWWRVARAQTTTAKTSSRPRCICYYSWLGKIYQGQVHRIRSSPKNRGEERVKLHRSNFTDRLTSGSLSADRQVRSLYNYFPLFAPGFSGYQSFRKCTLPWEDENHDIRGRGRKENALVRHRVLVLWKDLLPGCNAAFGEDHAVVEMKIGSTAHHV